MAELLRQKEKQSTRKAGTFRSDHAANSSSPKYPSAASEEPSPKIRLWTKEQSEIQILQSPKVPYIREDYE